MLKKDITVIVEEELQPLYNWATPKDVHNIRCRIVAKVVEYILNRGDDGKS